MAYPGNVPQQSSKWRGQRGDKSLHPIKQVYLTRRWSLSNALRVRPPVGVPWIMDDDRPIASIAIRRGLTSPEVPGNPRRLVEQGGNVVGSHSGQAL
jgi:hypothetical protein